MRRFNGKLAEMKGSQASLGPEEYNSEGKEILKCVKKSSSIIPLLKSRPTGERVNLKGGVN